MSSKHIKKKIDIEKIKEKLKKLEKENIDMKNSLLRERADFINYKKRVDTEKFSLKFIYESSIVLNLIPIYEAMIRAVENLKKSDKNNEWIKGSVSIFKMLKKLFDDMKIKRFGKKGDKFDANLHDAMTHEKGKKDTIIQVFEHGYTMNDKVIKPAKVSVGNGEK